MFTHLVIASIESFFIWHSKEWQRLSSVISISRDKADSTAASFQPLKLDPSVTCAKINGGQVLNGREKKEKPTPPMQCCWTQEFDLEFDK